MARAKKDEGGEQQTTKALEESQHPDDVAAREQARTQVDKPQDGGDGGEAGTGGTQSGGGGG